PQRAPRSTVFPYTTPFRSTTLRTGVAPGAHGLVGYRVLDPVRDRLVKQLTDWEGGGVDPVAWQAAPTVFEQARALGHPTFAVGLPEHSGTGFSRAILRGAQFHGWRAAAARVARSWQLAEEHDGALVYCYLPEVDKAGHKHGVDSAQWAAGLEDIDAALSLRIPDGVGVLVTADHGMVDVPAHR